MINALGSLTAQSAQLEQSLQPGALSGAQANKSAAASFQDTLTEAISSVNELQTDSDNLLKGLASGQHVDLHGTMIGLEKADISLRAMVSVRDKLLQAYEQVMNMTI
jgi:flagellar hook-basal body complex protein FliE